LKECSCPHTPKKIKNKKISRQSDVWLATIRLLDIREKPYFLDVELKVFL